MIVKSFKQYLLERDEKPSLFICCSLPKKIWQTCASGINVNDASEIEDEPHCSWLFSFMKKNYSDQYIYDILKSELSGVKFRFKVKGFDVFRGVENGTRHALVVKLEPPKFIVDLQMRTKEILKAHDIELKQTYPEWKPHMTIGYWPLDKPMEYDPNLKEIEIVSQIDYMSVSHGEKIKFNENI